MDVEKHAAAAVYTGIVLGFYHLLSPTAALACVAYMIVLSTWDVF